MAREPVEGDTVSHSIWDAPPVWRDSVERNVINDRLRRRFEENSLPAMPEAAVRPMEAIVKLAGHVESKGGELGPGWTAQLKLRTAGQRAGYHDTYFYSPEGSVYRSKVRTYLYIPTFTYIHTVHTVPYNNVGVPWRKLAWHPYEIMFDSLTRAWCRVRTCVSVGGSASRVRPV